MTWALARLCAIVRGGRIITLPGAMRGGTKWGERAVVVRTAGRIGLLAMSLTAFSVAVPDSVMAAPGGSAGCISLSIHNAGAGKYQAVARVAADSTCRLIGDNSIQQGIITITGPNGFEQSSLPGEQTFKVTAARGAGGEVCATYYQQQPPGRFPEMAEHGVVCQYA